MHIHDDNTSIRVDNTNRPIHGDNTNIDENNTRPTIQDDNTIFIRIILIIMNLILVLVLILLFMRLILILWGVGDPLVESTPFVRRVMGSTPALAAT